MNENSRQNKINTFFQNEAEKWDEMTHRYEPRYDEMLDEIVKRVNVATNVNTTMIELGCGTGNLTERFLRKYPNLDIICIDASEKMLEMASAKLKSYSNRVTYFCSGFEDLPQKECNYIVSTLALHHIDQNCEKIDMFQKIFNTLSINGSFWNGDITLCANPKDSQQDELDWMAWLSQNDFSDEQVKEVIERAHINDRPSSLIDQLKWMEKIGFKFVDCTWRYMGYAVYGGRK